MMSKSKWWIAEFWINDEDEELKPKAELIPWDDESEIIEANINIEVSISNKLQPDKNMILSCINNIKTE